MSSYRYNIIESMSEVDRPQWEAISDPLNPFLEYDFLWALEKAGCIGERTSWQIRFFLVFQGSDLVLAIPLFAKHDSYGEYIFDHEWAHFFQSNRLPYYPKGLVAAPFTPATGRRILTRPDQNRETLIREVIPVFVKTSLELGLSGIHFLFLTREEKDVLESSQFSTRITHQYHWSNEGYSTFEDYLERLKAKRRKEIKRERNKIREAGIQVRVVEGEDVTPEHISRIWSFYQDTHSRKWGGGYLNRKFFEEYLHGGRRNLVLVLANDGTGDIAGTFNLKKGNHLYGRYWGCTKYYPHLHFECCFYSLIDYSIQNQIQLFEAGAQGEHKFLRGFLTRPTYSSHWIFHKQARIAIERFLEQERMYMEEAIAGSNLHSPMKDVSGLEIQ